jgi:hypothetical protein
MNFMSRMQLSRRSLLGSVGAATVAPALPAATRDLAEAVAGLPRTVPAFEARLRTGPQLRSSLSQAQFSAAILGGELAGPLLQGVVQSGRIEWTIDSASRALHITAHYAVLRHDGVLVQIKDHGIHPQAMKPADSTRLRTSPEISVDGEPHMAASLLVGLLDASGFSSGEVTLRAFRVV